jgi:hypothetical protein
MVHSPLGEAALPAAAMILTTLRAAPHGGSHALLRRNNIPVKVAAP